MLGRLPDNALRSSREGRLALPRGFPALCNPRAIRLHADMHQTAKSQGKSAKNRGFRLTVASDSFMVP